MWLRRVLHGVVRVAREDYFQLFGLPAKFAIDRDALDATWRRLASRVHPDRHATAGAAERRVAMQWASTINDAYRILKTPIERARYLCEAAGCDLQAESNTRMNGEFLMRQMEWRERLDEVRGLGNPVQVQAIYDDILASRHETEQAVAHLIDEQHDFEQAAGKVREWMFIEKLLAEAQVLHNDFQDRSH